MLNVSANKKQKGVATKSNPALWSRCKSDAKRKMGNKWSARAAQYAVYLYKKRGGKYKGKKPTAKTNKLKKWTKQKWMYLSDYKKKKRKKAFEEIYQLISLGKSESNPGRYLPEAKWKALSAKEREATNKKKKREGKHKQYVSNTEKAKVHSKYKYYVDDTNYKYKEIKNASQIFEAFVLKKQALNEIEESLDEAVNAISYVSSILGAVPTPIGNPFSIMAASDELQAGNYFSSILYLLTAIPDLGVMAGSLKNFPNILRGIEFLIQTQTIPKSYLQKLIGLIVSYFQSTKWIQIARNALTSILIQIFTAPIAGEIEERTNKLKDFCKKAGVEAVGDIKNMCANLTNKIYNDLKEYQAQCVAQLNEKLKLVS